jgi:DNA-binding response OmpR family regulator
VTHLLLVDDDASLLRVLSEYLARLGYEIATASNGAEALTAAREQAFDLVVLDVTMPEMDGMEVLRSLRQETSVPVILMTALSEESDVLQGFGAGADDYVVKPFGFAQLDARIRAVLSRASRAAPAHEGERILRQGDLVVDLDAHRVRRGGEAIKLTPTEFRLLVTLMEHPGRVMPVDELVAKVWGSEYAGQVDYVRRYVWYLRQKLEEDPEAPRYIQNERNVGYYFAPQDANVPAQKE